MQFEQEKKTFLSLLLRQSSQNYVLLFKTTRLQFYHDIQLISGNYQYTVLVFPFQFHRKVYLLLHHWLIWKDLGFGKNEF